MRKLAILLVTAALATTALSLPPVNAGQGQHCKPGVAFENDEVRIWWHAKKPMLHILDKNTSSGAGQYDYKSDALVELDADGNAVSSMNLHRAHPDASVCTVEEDEEFVNLTLTWTDVVKGTTGGPIGESTVTFAYHFNKSAYGAKFDLIVNDWPWAEDAEDHTFAYDFGMLANHLELEPAENGVGVKDENGQSQGYVEWAENATATYEDGSEDEANVTASWEGDAHKLDLRLEFEGVEGGYVELYYDPWMGIGDYVIVLGRLIGLAPVEQALPPAVGRALRDLL